MRTELNKIAETLNLLRKTRDGFRKGYRFLKKTTNQYLEADIDQIEFENRLENSVKRYEVDLDRLLKNIQDLEEAFAEIQEYTVGMESTTKIVPMLRPDYEGKYIKCKDASPTSRVVPGRYYYLKTMQRHGVLVEVGDENYRVAYSAFDWTDVKTKEEIYARG